MITEVLIGNYHEAKWICSSNGVDEERISVGFDYVITEDDGRKFAYSLWTYDDIFVTQIPIPQMLTNEHSTSFYKIAEQVRKYHVRHVHPEISEEEENILVFGIEEGKKINEINTWADNHLIMKSRQITIDIRNKIGEFKSAKWNKRYHGYLIDNTWLVTFSDIGYKINCMAGIIASHKAFGDRITRIANKADVPWNVAVCAERLDDESAIDILKEIKTVREKVKYQPQIKLAYDKKERIVMLKKLLGMKTWQLLNCLSNEHICALSNYIISQE